MKYFWGAILGAVLMSLPWMVLLDSRQAKHEQALQRLTDGERRYMSATKKAMDELMIMRKQRDHAAASLKRLERNLCGDKTLTVEELSYRCD